MVTRVVNGDVEFIHASTSQGVIKSMLSERYWNNAFLRAGRIEE
jgi:cell wall-associated NlpC family hydrolase